MRRKVEGKGWRETALEKRRQPTRAGLMGGKIAPDIIT